MEKRYQHLIGNQFAKGNKPNKTAFKDGSVPWNKNVKGIHLSPKSEFKKGQKGINWTPVGTQKIRTDNNATKRRWIKIAEPSKWIEYAKYVWINNNGEIPNGFLIHHIDKDSLNDDISNLAMLTRSAHINIHRPDLLLAKRRIGEAETGVSVKEQKAGQGALW
jgi:hypothetical protein